MSLEEVHAQAYDYLASKPDYADFLPTLSGASQLVTGSPELGVKTADDAVKPIENIRGGVSNATKSLVEALLDNQDQLNWWNAYKDGDPAGKGMVDRTAAHAHRPDEIYAILSGQARFWDNHAGWREAGAGDVVHMPSMIWHGMETLEKPVLILWAWIGDGLGEKPVFRDNHGELPR